MQSWTKNFGSVVSWLVGIISVYNQQIFAGSVPMFGLAACSAQLSVHTVPPGHIVEIHTRINALMFGDRNLVRLTSRPATDISIVHSL